MPENLNGTDGITDPVKLIGALLRQNDGVFLGEKHSSIAQAEFLTKNMPALKAQGLDTLYMEGLRPEDQPFVNAFLAAKPGTPEQKTIDEKMMAFLKGRLEMFMPSSIQITFDNLIAARENGMRVIGMDCEGGGETEYDALKNRNAHWAKIIRENGGKYLIIGGADHSLAKDRGNPSKDVPVGIDTLLSIPAIDMREDRTVTTGKISPGNGVENDFVLSLPPSRYEGIGYPGVKYANYVDQVDDSIWMMKTTASDNLSRMDMDRFSKAAKEYLEQLKNVESGSLSKLGKAQAALGALCDEFEKRLPDYISSDARFSTFKSLTERVGKIITEDLGDQDKKRSGTLDPTREKLTALLTNDGSLDAFRTMVQGANTTVDKRDLGSFSTLPGSAMDASKKVTRS